MTTDAIAGWTCDPERDECVNGLRRVDRMYVERHQPNYPPPFPHPLTPAEEEANAKHVAAIANRRATLANSLYPCPVHDPDRFLLWRAGDWPYPKGSRKPKPMVPIGKPADHVQDEFADTPPADGPRDWMADR